MEGFEPGTRGDRGPATLCFDAEDFHAEQALDVNVGVGRCLRPRDRTLRFGLFLYVVRDAVGDGLAGLESWEEVDAIGTR